MTRLALLAALLPLACGGAYEPTPDRPAPSCAPGSTDVELVTAPPDLELPECVEVTAHSERGSDARAWCCWKAGAR